MPALLLTPERNQMYSRVQEQRKVYAILPLGFMAWASVPRSSPDPESQQVTVTKISHILTNSILHHQEEHSNGC